MKSEWISVNDRLPSEDGPVLVHCPSADDGNPLVTVAWYNPDGDGWSLIAQYWIDGIRHWMPLPAPPEGTSSTVTDRRTGVPEDRGV